VEFICRKSVAYLGYLCCRAEEWFARGWYLNKSRCYGRYDVQGRGRKWTHIWEILVFYLYFLILRNCREIWVLSPLSFYLVFFFFFKENNPYSHDSQHILRGSVYLSRPFLDG
jgi:hypothetical protein